MAAAASMQTPPGNPLFVKLEEKYKCQKCHGVVRDSMQTPCGHRLCKNCVEEMFTNGVEKVPCPANDEDCLEMTKKEIYPDPSGRREVRKIQVYCSNKDYGCKKQLQWRHLEKHLTECEYTPVDCPNKEYGCTEKMAKYSVAEHVQACSYRLLQCKYCGQNIPAILMEEHQNKICPAIEIPCPNSCGTPVMKRQDLGSHMEQCPNRQYHCKFEVVGCDFQGTEKQVTEHVLNDLNRHLEMVTLFASRMDLQSLEIRNQLQEVTSERDNYLKQVVSLQQDLTKVKVDIQVLKDANKDLKMKMVGMTERIIQLERRSEGMSNRELAVKHENDIQSVKTNIAALRTQITQVERQGGAGGAAANPVEMEEMKRKITLHEQQFGHLDVQLAELDLRFQILETASFNGVLLWKIQEYQRRKQEAISGKTLSLYSQPFYTHRHGYRMCARVYLNGDGMGKGTHLSLFFVVMRGDYDNLLEWPFKHKVTMMLLDQENGQRHLSDTFRPDPNSSSFRKPTSDMNIASGCPLFVAHSVLESPTYLKDDTVFIKMEVDLTQIRLP